MLADNKIRRTHGCSGRHSSKIKDTLYLEEILLRDLTRPRKEKTSNAFNGTIALPFTDLQANRLWVVRMKSHFQKSEGTRKMSADKNIAPGLKTRFGPPVKPKTSHLDLLLVPLLMPGNSYAPDRTQFPSGFFAPSATTDVQRNPYGQPNFTQAFPLPSSSTHAAHPGGIAGQHQGVVGYMQPVSQYGYATYPNPQHGYQNTQPPLCYNSSNPIGYAGSYLSQNYSHQQSPQAIPPLSPPTLTANKEKKFHCESCNLELDSAQALRTHQSTHVKCEKCSFTAAPKVIKGHFAAVHGQYSGSGFKSVTIAIPGVRKVQRFSICVGNHPDDIQRWIAERRKRFPRQSQKNQNAGTENSCARKEVCQTLIDSKMDSGILSSLLEGYGSSSSEDEENTQALTETEKVSSSAKNSSDIVSGVTTSATENENEMHQGNYRTRLCRYFMRNGKCRNGDHCNFSHDQSGRDLEHKRAHHDAPTSKKPKVARDLTVTSTRNLPTSLLRKLLANDVQREAALTLQLLEFLVMSNFLQDSSTESTFSANATDVETGSRI
jgi:Zinc finger C-x8-C-x5-C-x3-H type (and similar)/Nuclear fragile X mental retardation-interacting protein 1 (NUFIP1)